jgi:hypothetical protein
VQLDDLRGQRSAPILTLADSEALEAELRQRIQACQWFTVGVMADSASSAVRCLRQLETALGWPHLEPAPATGSPEAFAGAVFLKANQNTGRFLLRAETGLGEGLLITGHSPSDPDAEDTWGPLPLDFFGP